jgi:hypothetical protein
MNDCDEPTPLRMIGHHTAVMEAVALHDATKPFAPENGNPLRFNVGDNVIYTNDHGAEFRLRVTGFYRPDFPSLLYATGARYLVNSDAPWAPVEETSLRHD